MRRARSLRFSRGDDRGAVIPIIALSLVVLITMTAFSLDLGRQMVRRREAQSAADFVALDLARLVDGRTASAIIADPRWNETKNAAAARNGFATSGLTPELGVYSADNDSDLDPSTIAFTPCLNLATCLPTGVRVTATDEVGFFFAQVIGISKGTVTRTSTAAQQGSSEAELGSVFAGFQYYQEPGFSAAYNVAADLRAQVLNATIGTQFFASGTAGATLPTGIGLDALSYKGISNGSVTMGQLATAMGFGSADQMLDADISGRDLLNAEANALRSSSNQNDVTAGNKIAQFAGTSSSSTHMHLRDMIDATQGGGSDVANYRINALDLITMAGQIINGKHFFTMTVNHGIPGVPPLDVTVAIIEGPAVAQGFQGDPGPSTSQVRFATTIPLSNLVIPGFGTFQATVPIVVEAAKADSTFERIQCSNPSTTTATDLRVLTHGLNVQIGTISNGAIQNSQTLSVQSGAVLHGSLTLPLLGTTNLDAVTNVHVSKTFKGGAVYTGDLASNTGVLGADETHTFLGEVAPLSPPSWRYAGGVGSTNMSTTVLNAITLNAGAPAGLESALKTALVSKLGDMDKLFLDGVLSSLGVAIAGADGIVHYANCGPKLVN
ncbi:MAG: hypothetical protein QOI95_1819 [Acidimicrobiaceae bacterium]|jgi:uncharacterized membrane protein